MASLAPQIASRSVRRSTLLVVVAVTIAVAVTLVGARGAGNGVDFLAFYVAGKALLSGNASHLYDLAWITNQEHAYSSRVIAYLYPPAYALVFAPLGLLRLPAARVVWSLASVAALLLTIRVARSWSGLGNGTLAAALMYLPVLLAFVLGQTTFWMLLGFASIARLQWQGGGGA